MVTSKMLADGRRVLIVGNPLPAFFENMCAIGQNCVAIVEERAVSIQAPIPLAKKLRCNCENRSAIYLDVIYLPYKELYSLGTLNSVGFETKNSTPQY